MTRASALSLLIVCWFLAPRISLAQSLEEQDLRMAQDTFVERLAVENAFPNLCDQEICVSADPTELALALVAARNTSNSLRALAALHRFVFDGAVAERYDELLCHKARLIEKYVAALKPQELRTQCVAEFNAAAKSHRKALELAKVDGVCSSEKQIETKLESTLEMVRKPPMPCEP